ncbi:MAG TPA: arylesterase [Dongiaceae bacterium]|nr:arylesterase [Dongiaceae bacterium]
MSIMFPSSIPIWRRLAALALILVATLLLVRSAAADTKILALGDSLTAGYGLKQGEGFADQLQTAFRKMGRPVTVINGGVSGDTSAGGLARIDWALGDQPQVVIVELGANDMLRGVSPASTRANLAAIIDKAKASGAKVLLCGMKAQRNLGSDYVTQFDAIYPDLAKQEGVALYPFFMDGIIQADGSADRALLQGDGMHPSEAGAALIVQRIMPVLLPLLGG